MKKLDLKELIKEEISKILSESHADLYARGILGMLSPERESKYKNSQEVRSYLASKIGSRGVDPESLKNALNIYKKQYPEEMMDLNLDIQRKSERSTPWKRGSDEPVQIGRFSPTQGD